MYTMPEALSIAGLGVVIVFVVLTLLLLATRVMGHAVGDRSAGEVRPRRPSEDPDVHHMACIVAAVRATLGHVPAHLKISRLN